MGIRPLSPHEIERRRQVSVAELKRRESWEVIYGEMCDKLYWANGPCCAGCDHWSSDMGFTGQCTKAAIVSGAEVMKSMGLRSSSYSPAPGHPYTKAAFKCGEFKDDFDWHSLGAEYLKQIGASPAP